MTFCRKDVTDSQPQKNPQTDPSSLLVRSWLWVLLGLE